MKTGDTSVRELQALLDDWCNGTISRQGADRVNELIRGNRRLAWEYLCFMELHGALRCSLGDEPDGMEVRLPERISALAERQPVAPLSKHVPRSVPRTLWFSGAAAVLLCIFIALVAWQSWPEVGPIAKAPSANGNSDVVARLLSTSDCRWKAADRTVKNGDEFRRGDRLELESGFANFRTAQGAIITLRGPARLVLTGPNSVQLDSGNLTSEVPEEAKGFTVETASSRIVDVGTEFGVSAESDGQTALSVFQGVVEVAPRKPSGSVKAKRVFAGQALRINCSGTPGKMQTVDPEQFGLVCRPVADGGDGKENRIIHIDLKRLRSADELHITAEFVTAVNVGGDKSISVGGVTFTADDGRFVSSPVRKDPWGTLPWLGNSTDNLALCEVLHSIRFNLQQNPEKSGRITIAVPVPNGCYRLQLLLSENHHACGKQFSDRSINIDLEGQPCIRDLRMLAVQGIAGYPVPPTQAILLCCDLRVDDGVLDAMFFSKDLAPGIDPNVILNGLIIERIHPPSGE